MKGKTLASIVLAGVAALGSAAKGATLEGVEPFTSWSQLYVRGPPASPEIAPLNNSGNFYVDGALASDVKCGAGMLKEGQIIGYFNNGVFGMSNLVSGDVNVDSSSLTNYNALGAGQRNDGMYGTVDVNGDGDWGNIEFYDDGWINVDADIGELILDQNGVLVNDARGDFSSLPRYLGINGMENNGKLGKIEFDTSYAEVPEPTTLALLGLGGTMALLRRRNRQGLNFTASKK